MIMIGTTVIILTMLNKTDVLRKQEEFKSERGVCGAVDSNDCELNGSD